MHALALWTREITELCTSEGLHSSLSTLEEAENMRKTLKQKDERPIVLLLKSTDEHTFGICLSGIF